MRYAELDGVVYRAKKIGPVEKWAEKLEDGKWVENPDHFRVAREASLIEEAEAKELAGKDWPAEQE